MRKPKTLDPENQCPFCYSRRVEQLYRYWTDRDGTEDMEPTDEVRCLSCEKQWEIRWTGRAPCPCCGKFNDRDYFSYEDDGGDATQQHCRNCSATWKWQQGDKDGQLESHGTCNHKGKQWDILGQDESYYYLGRENDLKPREKIPRQTETK